MKNEYKKFGYYYEEIMSRINYDLWLEFVSYRREDTYENSNYISDGLDNAELFENALKFFENFDKERIM